LLSDVHMPETDGYDLVEEIRRDGSFNNLKIVFLTSAGGTGDLERCEELNVAERLMKPVKQSELIEVMVRTMAGLPTDAVEGRLNFQSSRQSHIPPQRILLVEDSKPNQRLACAILNERGHEVTIAENGIQALEMLEQSQFDIVLMDVQMPVMDGLEATAQIRQREGQSSRHQQIIAMTAHSIEGDRERCLEAGMNDYVAKPIRRETLFLALANAAQRNGTLESKQDCRASLPQVGSTRSPDRTGTESHVHLNKLLSQLNGNRTQLAEIAESYIQESEDSIRRLKVALDNANLKELRRLAHGLKGAMQMFDATTAAEGAQKLEELAESNELAAAESLLASVEVNVDITIRALKIMLNEETY